MFKGKITSWDNREVGLIYNKRVNSDNSTDEKLNIFAEQLSKEKLNLQFVYIVKLVDNSKGLTPN